MDLDYLKFKKNLKIRKIPKKFYPDIFDFTILLAAWKKTSSSNDLNISFQDLLRGGISEERLKEYIRKNSGIIDNESDYFFLLTQNHSFAGFDEYKDISMHFIANTTLPGNDLYKNMLDACSILSTQQQEQLRDLLKIMTEIHMKKQETGNIYIIDPPDTSILSNKYNWFIDQTDKRNRLRAVLYKALTGSDQMNIGNKDPLMTGSTYDSPKFDMAMTVIPSNKNAVIPENSHDLYTPYKGGQYLRYGETVYWKKLLSVSQNVVICSYAGPLFRGGSEELYRKELVDNKIVSSVVLIHEEMNPLNRNSLEIVVLDKSGKSDTIQFIDASNIRAPEDIPKLLKKPYTRKDIWKTVTPDTVRENHYSLIVTRYLRKEDNSEHYTPFRKLALKDICTIIRPQNIRAKHDTYQEAYLRKVYDIKSKDFSQYGFTRRKDVFPFPDKERIILVDPEKKGKLINRYEVEPFDIIITTTGAVGAVALLAEDFSDNGKIPVVASQTTHILRFNLNKKERSIFLYVYLKSHEGQNALKRVSNTANIPTIKSRDLKELKIPEMNKLLIRNAIYTFHRIIEINEEIKIAEMERSEFNRFNTANIRIFNDIFYALPEDIILKEKQRTDHPVTIDYTIRKREEANCTTYYDNFYTLYRREWRYRDKYDICLRFACEPLSQGGNSANFYWGITLYEDEIRINCNEEIFKDIISYLREHLSGTDIESDISDDRFLCSKYFNATYNYNFKDRSDMNSLAAGNSLYSKIIRNIKDELNRVMKVINDYVTDSRQLL